MSAPCGHLNLILLLFLTCNKNKNFALLTQLPLEGKIQLRGDFKKFKCISSQAHKRYKKMSEEVLPIYKETKNQRKKKDNQNKTKKESYRRLKINQGLSRH